MDNSQDANPPVRLFSMSHSKITRYSSFPSRDRTSLCRRAFLASARLSKSSGIRRETALSRRLNALMAALAVALFGSVGVFINPEMAGHFRHLVYGCDRIDPSPLLQLETDRYGEERLYSFPLDKERPVNPLLDGGNCRFIEPGHGAEDHGVDDLAAFVGLDR